MENQNKMTQKFPKGNFYTVTSGGTVRLETPKINKAIACAKLAKMNRTVLFYDGFYPKYVAVGNRNNWTFFRQIHLEFHKSLKRKGTGAFIYEYEVDRDTVFVW
jgi:hypothetical protein